MKRTSKELKRIARDILNNRYTIPMGAFVTAGLIPAVIEIPFSMFTGDNPTTKQLIITGLAEFLIMLIGQVLTIGVYQVHLNMTRSKEFRLSQIFDPFRSSAERHFGASLLYFIFSILACVPGILGTVYFYFTDITATSIGILCVGLVLSMILAIIITLNYQMIFFLLLDHPQMKVRDAFKESRLMMRGNKMRLFYITLSFIGWDLLNLCSLGIAALWITPYQTETLIVFYLDCKAELDQLPVRDYSKETSFSGLFF